MFEKFVENITTNVIVLRTVVATELINSNINDLARIAKEKERKKEEERVLRIARERQMEAIRNRYYQRFGVDYIK